MQSHYCHVGPRTRPDDSSPDPSEQPGPGGGGGGREGDDVMYNYRAGSKATNRVEWRLRVRMYVCM